MDKTTLQRLQVESQCRTFFRYLDEQKAIAIKQKDLKEKQALDFMRNNYYIIDNYKTHTLSGEVISYSHVPKGKFAVSYSEWCDIFNIIFSIQTRKNETI